MDKQNMPTLQEAVEHMEVHGGHLKAKKNGVTWEEDEPDLVYGSEEERREIMAEDLI